LFLRKPNELIKHLCGFLPDLILNSDIIIQVFNLKDILTLIKLVRLPLREFKPRMIVNR